MKRLLAALGLSLAAALASAAGSSVTSTPAFVQAGTGAVPRTISDKLRESVSAIDFGADKTGVADSKAAIQKALDTGKSVRLPAGTYKITAGLSHASPAVLFGDGPGQTTINVVGSGYDAVTLATSDASIKGVGFTAATARTAGAYVKISTASRGNNVDDFKMENAFVGLHIAAEAVINRISDGEINNSAPGTGVGILVEGGNDTFITRVVMDNPAGSQPLAGIRLRRTQAIWVTDTDVIHGGTPLLIDPDGGAGGYITWGFFKSFAGDLSSGPGVKIAPSNAAQVRGLFFSNGWTSSNLRGMEIAPVTGGVVDTVSITDHNAFNNSQEGLLVSGGSNVAISASRLAGNSQALANTYSGVKFAAGVSHFSVLGTRSGAIAGFSASQKYGVEILTGSDAYMVQNNDLTGNATGAYADGSFGTAGTKQVRNNQGVKTRAIGVATITAGTNAATVTHGLLGTPTIVTATPSNSNLGGLSLWAGSYGGTQFSLNTSANVAADTAIAWEAIMAE